MRHQDPATKTLLFEATALLFVQLVVVVPVYTKTMYRFENNTDMDLDIACKLAHKVRTQYQIQVISATSMVISLLRSSGREKSVSF